MDLQDTCTCMCASCMSKFTHILCLHALGPAKIMDDGWVGDGRRFSMVPSA